MALDIVLFMKGELFALMSFSFIGACLFNMFIKIVSKSSNFASSFKANNLYYSSFLKFSLIKFL